MELIEKLKIYTSKSKNGLYTTKEREEYKKICYEICEKVNWQISKLNKIEEKVGIKGTTILRNAKNYIIENQSKSRKYANEYAETKRRETLLNDCYDACEKNDWNIENLRMASRLLKLKEEKIIENAIFYIIKYKYSPKEALEQEEYYKAQFDICNSYGWNFKELNKIALELNLILEEVINNAKIYMVDYKKMTDDDIKQIIITSKKEYLKKYYQNNKKELFDKLLNMPLENSKDIISFISLVTEDNNVRLIALRESGISYAYIYHPKITNKIVVEIENRINIYKKYIETQRKPKKRLKSSVKRGLSISIEQCLEDFIISDCKTLEIYCREKNVDIDEIKRALSHLKKARNSQKIDLYKRYLISILKKGNKEENLISIAHRMIELITNGIETKEGTKRNFDIIDYYSLTNLEFEDFMLLVTPHLKISEIKTLKIYCDRNHIITPEKLDINNLKTEKIKLGYSIQKKDSKEIYYPSLKEIELIEEYLKERNVPFNNTSYKDAMKRLLVNITLNKESNKVLVKIK